MPQFLLFQLAGPMASWGEIAVGEDRHSASFPTRSAILGILASALGIPRSDERGQHALAEGYRVAVITCAAGELLRDYHTAQVPSAADTKGWHLATRRDELAVIEWTRRTKGKGGEAILSFRDYRCDGRWIAAVQPGDTAPYPLAALRDALLRPRFVLYLGRKSCPPGLPLEPQVIDASTLVEALTRARFHAPAEPRRRKGAHHRRAGDLTLRWEPGLAAGLEPRSTVERWDDPTSRRRWQFRPRLEHSAPLPEEVWPCS